MPFTSKVLVVFEHPATLKELMTSAAAASLQVLAVRDRRAAISAVQTNPEIRAVLVEHGATSQGTIELLQNLQAIRPKLRRVIVMDAPDLTSVVNGLHSGSIDSILYRPADARHLYAAVMDGNLPANPIATHPATPMSATAASARMR